MSKMADAGIEEQMEAERLRLKPTEFGRTLWTDGFYEEWPCTCTEKCGAPCKGKCGCAACHNAYQDYLSMPDS